MRFYRLILAAASPLAVSLFSSAQHLTLLVPDLATVRKTNLWSYLRSTPVPAVDAVVTLPVDCSWLEEPGSESIPMLIRKSYVEIFDSMMATANAEQGIRGYVTLGNPGVGKSRFLSYCLWRFAKDCERRKSFY